MFSLRQMARIVAYVHHYKRPPRKKKPVALEVPAVVRTKPARRPGNSPDDSVPAKSAESPAKSVIVTVRKHGSEVRDMTPEEH
jgi:hypothetical protein